MKTSIWAAALVLLAGFAGGCATVQNTASSLQQYESTVSLINQEYGQALRDFNQAISTLPSNAQAETLKQEAIAALQQDLEQAKQNLQAVQPPLQKAAEHLKLMGVLEAANRLIDEAAKASKNISADTLRTTATELEKLAGQIKPATQPAN